MSIQTELTRITNAKAAIKTAIEGKGVDVPSGAKLDALAALVESIQAGGVGGIGEYAIESGTFTPAEAITDSYVIETHFRERAAFFVCYRDPYYLIVGGDAPRGISVIGYVPLKKLDWLYAYARFGGYVGGAGINNNNLNYHDISASKGTYTITCSSTAPLSANRYHWIAVAVSEEA